MNEAAIRNYHSPSSTHRPGVEGARQLSPASANLLEVRGRSERWGDVSAEVRAAVVSEILAQSQQLPVEDRALFLSIAQLESGFNPSAKSKSSSASGVFQIIERNFENFKVGKPQRFDLASNTAVGLALFNESRARIQRQYPAARGNERAVLIYADYHDGPKRNLDGASIARRDLLPLLAHNRRLAQAGAAKG